MNQKDDKKMMNKKLKIFNYHFWESNKKMIDKKAVSLLISYVLLVSFAIIMGVLVYNWMKSYVPGEGLACPEGTSLFIKDAYCDKDTLKFNLTLENNGRFDIAGFYIHATNSSSQTLATIDLSKVRVSGGSPLGSSIIFNPTEENSIEPSETTEEVKFQLSEEIYSIELIPIRLQEEDGKEKYISCWDAKVKREIICM